MAKKRRKRTGTRARCVRKTIKIKSKRGRVIAEFMGRQGPGCGPRKKPSTAHLRPYKAEFKAQAKACKGRSRGAFLKCMSRLKGTLPAPR